MGDIPGSSRTPKRAAATSLGCSAVYVDSVKAMAESIGIANLNEEGAKVLAEDVTYRIKSILQDAVKFMEKAKRKKMSMQDFENAMKLKNIEPLLGLHSEDAIPYRFASGGGREIHFIEEEEVDLLEFLKAPMPKIPYDVSVRAHWLAIEGVQPAVPENPPLRSKDLQRLDSVDPATKLQSDNSRKRPGPYAPVIGKPIQFKASEQVYIKQLATHELSVEQQLYYKEITECCVGSDELRRTEALQSLTNDPGLYEMLPRLSIFIAEGVKVNAVQSDLALLIYLMRMVKAILDNPNLYLEKYLHELIPSIITCIVSKQLCRRPETDNHWALRDFASKLLAHICKHYSTSTNNIQTRVTTILTPVLINEKQPLTSLYGAIAALSEFGPEVTKVFILKSVRNIGMRLEFCLHGVVHTQADKISANRIKQLLVKYLSPILKSKRYTLDLEEYKAKYGYMGAALYSGVVQLRSQEAGPAEASTAFKIPQAPPSKLVLAQKSSVQGERLSAQQTSSAGQKSVQNNPKQPSIATTVSTGPVQGQASTSQKSSKNNPTVGVGQQSGGATGGNWGRDVDTN